MTEPIGHAAEAMKAVESARLWQEGEGSTDATQLADVLIAQTHATLALVAAQDRANELKRIEILVTMAYSDWDVLSRPGIATLVSNETADIAPSIARPLGLGGESDGE